MSSLLDERYLVSGLANENGLNAPANSIYRVKLLAKYMDLDEVKKEMAISTDIPLKIARLELIRSYRQFIVNLSAGGVIIDKTPNASMVRLNFHHAVFPESLFILVYRDPVVHISGMRRKWPIFDKAPLDEVLDFWNQLHSDFIRESEDYSDNVIFINLADLLARTDEALDYLAARAGLTSRTIRLPRGSRGNARGYGLRNVVNGRIQVDQSSNTIRSQDLNQIERETIEAACTPTYEKLNELAWR